MGRGINNLPPSGWVRSGGDEKKGKGKENNYFSSL